VGFQLVGLMAGMLRD